ncbi:hypothetical protein ACF073_37980 [Streptomyces sp. NPDC015171]|uniref:hypothetical protein n=1 Tax=Streptomyces sp. NPDC015171 TaxID=3364945 RepID=UPI0036FD547F
MRKTAGSDHHAVFDFGSLTVTALLDGYVDLPPTRLRDTGERVLEPVPEQVPLVEDLLRLSVNAFLVDDGKRRVLVDTGASNSWDPTMGRLPQSLGAAGVDRASITGSRSPTPTRTTSTASSTPTAPTPSPAWSASSSAPATSTSSPAPSPASPTASSPSGNPARSPRG